MQSSKNNFIIEAIDDQFNKYHVDGANQMKIIDDFPHIPQNLFQLEANPELKNQEYKFLSEDLEQSKKSGQIHMQYSKRQKHDSYNFIGPPAIRKQIEEIKKVKQLLNDPKYSDIDISFLFNKVNYMTKRWYNIFFLIEQSKQKLQNYINLNTEGIKKGISQIKILDQKIKKLKNEQNQKEIIDQRLKMLIYQTDIKKKKFYQKMQQQFTKCDNKSRYIMKRFEEIKKKANKPYNKNLKLLKKLIIFQAKKDKKDIKNNRII